MVASKQVELRGEEVTPEKLAELAGDREMDLLTIWGGGLKSAQLEGLRNLTWLKGLCIGENPVDDGILPYLQPMRDLEYLGLTYTNMLGDFSPLAGLPLQDVRLERCRFVGDRAAQSLANFQT